MERSWDFALCSRIRVHVEGPGDAYGEGVDLVAVEDSLDTGNARTMGWMPMRSKMKWWRQFKAAVQVVCAVDTEVEKGPAQTLCNIEGHKWVPDVKYCATELEFFTIGFWLCFGQTYYASILFFDKWKQCNFVFYRHPQLREFVF